MHSISSVEGDSTKISLNKQQYTPKIVTKFIINPIEDKCIYTKKLYYIKSLYLLKDNLLGAISNDCIFTIYKLDLSSEKITSFIQLTETNNPITYLCSIQLEEGLKIIYGCTNFSIKVYYLYTLNSNEYIRFKFSIDNAHKNKIEKIIQLKQSETHNFLSLCLNGIIKLWNGDNYNLEKIINGDDYLNCPISNIIHIIKESNENKSLLVSGSFKNDSIIFYDAINNYNKVNIINKTPNIGINCIFEVYNKDTILVGSKGVITIINYNDYQIIKWINNKFKHIICYYEIDEENIFICDEKGNYFIFSKDLNDLIDNIHNFNKGEILNLLFLNGKYLMICRKNGITELNKFTNESL